MAHATVDDYLASLPADRRAALAHVRAAINARLPPGYEEAMQFGMITWIVPASRLAATYNGQPLAVASLASQKQHMALYLMSVYCHAELATWFRAAYRASGKKLDMGKSCVRFKTLDALALDVVGEAIARVPVDAYVATYEASRSMSVVPKPIGGAANPAPASQPAPATRGAAPATTPAAPATRVAAAKGAVATERAGAKPAAPTKRAAARPAPGSRGR